MARTRKTETTPAARLMLGDCLDGMRRLEAGSVDSVVTDPPAGIAFMGKGWDSFGGRSNPHAQRDRAANHRGSGRGLGNQPFGYSSSSFPRSARERQSFLDFLTPRLDEARRVARPGAYALIWGLPRTSHWTGAAIEDAGWTIRDRVTHLFGQGFPKSKSCLKPAAEDWWLAVKPGLRRVAPLHIDACRIESNGDHKRGFQPTNNGRSVYGQQAGFRPTNAEGRWAANVILDGGAAAILDAQSGTLKSGKVAPHHMRNASRQVNGGGYGGNFRDFPLSGFGDSGGASRFFYCPKASRSDRDEGNTHPTVKATKLMSWLIRLITPPGGIVLDPFGGSGSTGKAAILGGYGFVGFESSPEYHAIGKARLAAARRSVARRNREAA